MTENQILSEVTPQLVAYGLVVRVFANGRVIPNTLKMLLFLKFTFLLKTQQYKVRIKGKMEQSRERSSSY